MAICEKKLIEDIEYYISHTSEQSGEHYAYKKCKELVERQPKVGEWIPVSERLPDKPEFGEIGYLVQEKHVCEPFSAYWDGGKWTDSDGYILGEVLAWMPLPEPYKEK